jgi:nitroreductase
MNIVKSLEWRYASKRMNGQIISDANLNEIQEAIRLSASSIGLQPYKVLVVSSSEAKKKLAPTAYNQPQVLECSHLMVFTVWDRMTDSKAEEYLGLVQSERGVTRESLSTLVGYLDNLNCEQTRSGGGDGGSKSSRKRIRKYFKKSKSKFNRKSKSKTKRRHKK